MGRLIDADDFKKFLQALCKAGAPYEEVVQLLDKQPTAYDVEKVVAELEQKMELLHKMAYREISKNGHSWDFECFSGQKMAYEHAIEIVRNGGKE